MFSNWGHLEAMPISVGHVFASHQCMLELSNFQIFFMVLHAGILVFLTAFLTRGASQKSDNVVPYNEMKRRRRKRKSKKKSMSTSENPSWAEVTEPGFRDVREVREVRETLQASSSNQLASARYQLSSPERKSS